MHLSVLKVTVILALRFVGFFESREQGVFEKLEGIISEYNLQQVSLSVVLNVVTWIHRLGNEQ